MLDLKSQMWLNSLAKAYSFICSYFDQRITLTVSQDPKLHLICLQSYIPDLNVKEGNESDYFYVI